MPICNFYDTDQIYNWGGVELNIRGTAECSLPAIDGTELCILHLDAPDKNVRNFESALSQAIMNSTQGDNFGAALTGIKFPRNFNFYRFWRYVSGRLPIVSELPFKFGYFYSDPFDEIKDLKKLESKFVSIDLDSGIFAQRVEAVFPDEFEFEIYFSRCRFHNSLEFVGGDEHTRIHLTDIYIEESLLLRDLGAIVNFGTNLSDDTGLINIKNIAIVGRIKAPLNIRHVKLRNGLQITNALVSKQFSFEQISNNNIRIENSFFDNAKTSFIDKINFYDCYFTNTNFLEANLRRVNWKYVDSIFGLTKNPFPVVKSDSLDYLDVRELEGVYRSLRLNYLNSGNQIEASNFHYREMHENFNRKSFMYKIANWNSIYGHLSCWGNSVSRSALCFLLSMSIFSLFYFSYFDLYLIGISNPILPVDSFSKGFYSIVFSFKNAFLLRPKFLIPQGPFGEFIVGVQMVFSALQIFLISITMRRRIKF